VNDDREEAHSGDTDPHDHGGDGTHHDHHEHDHEDGWHDEYRHYADHHGMPEDEEWTQPEAAVTGDPPDDIPEEKRKRMHDENRDI
jgi:hypothetical protein